MTFTASSLKQKHWYFLWRKLRMSSSGKHSGNTVITMVTVLQERYSAVRLSVETAYLGHSSARKPASFQLRRMEGVYTTATFLCSLPKQLYRVMNLWLLSAPLAHSAETQPGPPHAVQLGLYVLSHTNMQRRICQRTTEQRAHTKSI